MIFGLTGMNGAGKDTFANYIIDKYVFHHLSARKILKSELKKRNLPTTRENLQDIGNLIRKENGSNYILEKMISEIEIEKNNILFNSIRNVATLNTLRKDYNAIIIGINADKKIRYDRIIQRHGEIDQISYDDFLNLEKKESFNDGLHEQNLTRCIELSDYVLDNNFSERQFSRNIEILIKGLGV